MFSQYTHCKKFYQVNINLSKKNQFVIMTENLEGDSFEKNFGNNFSSNGRNLLGKFRSCGSSFFFTFHKVANGTYKHQNVQRRIFNACNFISAQKIFKIFRANKNETLLADSPCALWNNRHSNGSIHLF